MMLFVVSGAAFFSSLCRRISCELTVMALNFPSRPAVDRRCRDARRSVSEGCRLAVPLVILVSPEVMSNVSADRQGHALVSERATLPAKMSRAFPAFLAGAVAAGALWRLCAPDGRRGENPAANKPRTGHCQILFLSFELEVDFQFSRKRAKNEIGFRKADDISHAPFSEQPAISPDLREQRRGRPFGRGEIRADVHQREGGHILVSKIFPCHVRARRRGRSC